MTRAKIRDLERQLRDVKSVLAASVAGIDEYWLMSDEAQDVLEGLDRIFGDGPITKTQDGILSVGKRD